MHQLLREENFKVKVDPQILAVKEIKALVDRDKTKDKRKFVLEMTYAYHMISPSSTFDRYTNDRERHERVVQSLAFKEGWQPDPELETAIAVLRELSDTISRKSLRTTKNALRSVELVIDSLRQQIETQAAEGEIPFETLPDLMKSAHELLKLANAIPATIKKISDLEEEIRKEASTGDRVQGGGSIGLFES
ncbi:hypothetical protein [Phaeodactylibacter xiamenensis]|jgi:uncharacterized protein (DUF2267 family)|uniref:hypothetical protein n=1 Tax=Phaeodactylibacter xiamenensis TaxID=1524460 RepID=UPI003CCBEBD2